MMKIVKILFPAFAALFMFVGCNQNAIPERPGRKAEVTVSISAPSMGTKVSVNDMPNDGNVKRLDVFIYKENGVLESHGSITNATSLAISSSTGSKEIWAIVNGPDLSSVSEDGTSTLAQLKAISIALGDNAADGFVMTGSKNVTLEGNTPVSIDVYRVATRVVIKKITKNFSVAANQAKEFKIVGIYLTNVQGANDLGLESFQASNGTWFNKMMHEDSNSHAYLYDNVNRVVNGSYETAHYFYGMPNDAAVADDVYAGNWSKRLTRLVIEATLDGETMYYPITMNLGFARNKSYEFNEVIITKKGSNDPDTPVNSEDIAINVTVKDWETVFFTSSGQNEGVYVF